MARAMGPFPGYRDARCSGVAKPVGEGQRRIDAGSDRAASLRRERNPGRTKSSRYLKEEAAKVWDSAAELGKRHGYRNAQVTVLAPTGTISFLMDCDTTGIEPDIALVKYKLLAGGGMLKIVNQTVTPALEKLGYNSEEIERIIAHIDAFDTIEDVADTDGSTISSGLKPEHLPIFDCAFKAYQGRAQPQLHGASADDGGGAAVPQRRDFQDGQHAGNGDRRRHHEHLRRRVAAWLESDRDLSRRLEAFRAAEHAQDERHGRSGRRSRAEPRSIAESLESASSSWKRNSRRCAAGWTNRSRHRMPDTRMSLTHKFEIAGHEGYITVGLYRRWPAGRAVHHDGEGRQHDRRVDGHRRHAHLASRCNTACRWRAW